MLGDVDEFGGDLGDLADSGSNGADKACLADPATAVAGCEQLAD